MIFGFNTDVQGADAIYHVQTEDRGPKNPVIESIVYLGGVIQGKCKTPYVVEESPREEIEELVREQHRGLVEAIRAGTWTPESHKQAEPPSPPAGYRISLLNPWELRNGEQLRFHLLVRAGSQLQPAGEVALQVQWLVSGAVAEKQTVKTGSDGTAEIMIPAPAEQNDATLLVRAQGPQGKELAKFQVRVADDPAT